METMSVPNRIAGYAGYRKTGTPAAHGSRAGSISDYTQDIPFLR